MMAASAIWSTSLTKSFGPLRLIFRMSRSCEPRLMIAPAARAALMAMLSMGCRDCDMDRPGSGGERGAHAGAGGMKEQGRQSDNGQWHDRTLEFTRT